MHFTVCTAASSRMTTMYRLSIWTLEVDCPSLTASKTRFRQLQMGFMAKATSNDNRALLCGLSYLHSCSEGEILYPLRDINKVSGAVYTSPGCSDSRKSLCHCNRWIIFLCGRKVLLDGQDIHSGLSAKTCGASLRAVCVIRCTRCNTGR
ncbi:hypothetical protein BDP27DRAFT_1023696 [Rhodocollybia butyracea]|uniref:Uncharacterized protein n=1 Tax=Rhodocollybia butyracea TaxID=206335 RepID=A0A9P5U5Z4_9AGAR|nr:hypothetical protein BDP27DRAFT_1023696 [Rhodocollybia butyracea]